MQDVVERPRSRVVEEKARRRRRDDLSDGRLKNLDVAGDMDPDFVYRWINDDPGRVHQLTVRDDWDRVTEDMLGQKSEKDRQVGSGVERVVEKGTGKKAILVRKRREYYQADKAKEQAQIAQLEDAIKRGETPTAPGGEQTLRPGQNAYVPAGGISIGRPG